MMQVGGAQHRSVVHNLVLYQGGGAQHSSHKHKSTHTHTHTHTDTNANLRSDTVALTSPGQIMSNGS